MNQDKNLYIIAHVNGKRLITNGITYTTIEAARAKVSGDAKIFKIEQVS